MIVFIYNKCTIINFSLIFTEYKKENAKYIILKIFYKYNVISKLHYYYYLHFDKLVKLYNQ